MGTFTLMSLDTNVNMKLCNIITKFLLLLMCLFLSGTLHTQSGQHCMEERERAQKHPVFGDYHLTIVVYVYSPLKIHIVTSRETFLNFKQLLHT